MKAKLLGLGFVLAFGTGQMHANAEGSKLVFRGRAVFTVKEQHVDEFRKEVSKIIAPTRKEKGCIKYDSYQIADSNGKLLPTFEFHEIWISKDAMLVDHKEDTSHMKYFFNAIKLGKPNSWIKKSEISGEYVEIIKGELQ